MGAGTAGILAAIFAAARGASVLVLDAAATIGGTLCAERIVLSRGLPGSFSADRPAAAEELMLLYAPLFIAALATDASDVAIMFSGVRFSDIRRTTMSLEEERLLRRANEIVVVFIRAQPSAQPSGSGVEASSDMMFIRAYD